MTVMFTDPTTGQLTTTDPRTQTSQYRMTQMVRNQFRPQMGSQSFYDQLKSPFGQQSPFPMQYSPLQSSFRSPSPWGSQMPSPSPWGSPMRNPSPWGSPMPGLSRWGGQGPNPYGQWNAPQQSPWMNRVTQFNQLGGQRTPWNTPQPPMPQPSPWYRPQTPPYTQPSNPYGSMQQNVQSPYGNLNFYNDIARGIPTSQTQLPPQLSGNAGTGAPPLNFSRNGITQPMNGTGNQAFFGNSPQQAYNNFQSGGSPQQAYPQQTYNNFRSLPNNLTGGLAALGNYASSGNNFGWWGK